MATEQAPYWLCIIGTSGTGKTHVSGAICAWFKNNLLGQIQDIRDNQLTRKDYRFRTWAKMMAKLYGGEYDGFEEIAGEYLLVLDDLAATHDPSKFGVSKLLELMNKRERKWTVFTSNLNMQQIAEMDTRIASRLIRHGSKVIEMNCKDYNL